MELASLQAFVAVAEAQSFSRAADALFLTQSAVSKRISALEAELHTRLFDRVGRSIHLTEGGRALLPRARRVLAEAEASRRAVMDLQGTVGGFLRIGTSHHIGLHRLPPVLRAFTAAYPQVELDLHFMESEQACLAVERGELELAVVTLPEQAAEVLLTESLWADPLDLYVGPEHPLAGGGPVSPPRLATEPAILPAPGTVTRRIVSEAFRPHVLHVRLETNFLETIRMLVNVGLGWSALPRTLAGEDLVRVDVDGIELRRNLGLVRHRGRTAGNAARAFRTIARARSALGVA